MADKNLCDEVVARIEEYNRSIFGFDLTILEQDKIEELLDIDTKTTEEMSFVAAKLIQHCAAVQFKLNKVNAVINYLTDVIRDIVAPSIPQYKGMSWEYAEKLAIKNDAAAYEYSRKLREYKLIRDGSQALLNQLTDLAKKLDSIKYVKF